MVVGHGQLEADQHIVPGPGEDRAFHVDRLAQDRLGLGDLAPELRTLPKTCQGPGHSRRYSGRSGKSWASRSTSGSSRRKWASASPRRPVLLLEHPQAIAGLGQRLAMAGHGGELGDQLVEQLEAPCGNLSRRRSQSPRSR